MFQTILESIYKEVNQLSLSGKQADYIPELAKVSPDKFAINITDLQGRNYGIGDISDKFSLQSIAKVFAFALAYQIKGNAVFEHVGVEPSGDPFNSLIQLEQEEGFPRNPLINAGALSVCDVLISELKHPEEDLFNFIKLLSGNETIGYNQAVYQSEKQTGFRNRALIYLMKSFDRIQNDAEEVLDLYFKLCALEMTVKELSETFLVFANEGVLPYNNQRVLTKSQTKRTNAIMQTCGFYDEAGEFTFKVGLPGKSGVGGGIAALHPGKYTVAVWSPLLNKKGNSVKGMKALELLTTKLGWSIF
ncbi:MAG TPA: glutaminase [Flavobacteriales bacterium]|jgi:glutaminase|nr:glutaminase [Flavobacteriales bacterium]